MITTNTDTKEKQCLSCGKNFTPERRTKKYCGDTCKQNAFYQRNAGSQEALNDNSKILFKELNTQPFDGKRQEKNEENNLLSEAVEIADENKLSLTSVTLNDKPETINESVSDNINSVLLSAKYRNQTDKDSYQAISSRFINGIAELVEEYYYSYLKFGESALFWTSDVSAAVAGVNTKLRNLTEHLLCLSSQKEIDRKTFVYIRNAFNALVISTSFKRLPLSYPYSELIKEIEQQCNSIAASQKKGSSFRLQLSVKRKAEFIAIRHILAASAPKIKFSELNFGE